MKEAIIVSLAKEGMIGVAIYPFNEELYASLRKLQSTGLVKVERHEVPAYMMQGKPFLNNNQAEDVPIHIF